jgi:hypothetical protein
LHTHFALAMSTASSKRFTISSCRCSGSTCWKHIPNRLVHWKSWC